ncbi:MAG: leucyl aminopeptidase [Nocardioidaceae bacterium]|nr:leucyl aminopeptidase [Nocardioidaceae bacterium]
MTPAATRDGSAPGTIIVPVGVDGGVPPTVLRAVAGLGIDADLEAWAPRLGLRRPGDTAVLPLGSGADVLLTAVGGADPALEHDHVRQAAMAAARRLSPGGAAVNLTGTWSDEEGAYAAAAEGWTLGAYAYAAPSDGAVLLSRMAPGDVRHAGPEEVVREAVVAASATNLARDLVNAPPGQLVPERLASLCADLGAALGFDVRVHRRPELEAGGFGGILGVGRGSENPPVLVELARGAGDSHVALVGKGITFDAGGLSLKTSRGMLTMKADMSGAAAVLGAFVALATLGSDVSVRGYLACAENMPGPSATRIGDVLRHRGGRTVEVTDADCEGRLVVGDALAYAVEHAPAAIVDLATLTSSSGLGPQLWAGFGNDRPLLDEVLSAGSASGEPGWPMPLWEPYRPGLRSDVADARNFDPDATQAFGGITAALYLRPFVDDVPWAHVDLGLTVMRSAADDIWAGGAYGRGVRTLTRFLRERPRARTGAAS